MTCTATNGWGAPCGRPAGADGVCDAHAPGAAERMAERGRLGGQATRVKLAGAAFEPDELPALATIEDAKRALDQVRVAVMTRRLTHAEGNAASKSVAEWVKAETAAITARLVNELRAELEGKADEIAELRKALAAGPRRATG